MMGERGIVFVMLLISATIALFIIIGAFGVAPWDVKVELEPSNTGTVTLHQSTHGRGEYDEHIITNEDYIENYFYSEDTLIFRAYNPGDFQHKVETTLQYEEEGIGTPEELECEEKYCNLDQLLEYTLHHADELVEVGDTVETEGRLVAVEPTPGEIRDTLNEMGQQNLSQYNTDDWATSHRLIDVEWSDQVEELIKGADKGIHIPKDGLPGPGTNNIEITKGKLEGTTYYNITYTPQEDQEHYNAPEYYQLHKPMQRAVDADLAREFKTLIYIDENVGDTSGRRDILRIARPLIEDIWNERSEQFEEEPPTLITETEFEAHKHGIKIGLCENTTEEGQKNCEKVKNKTGDPETPAIFLKNNKIHIIAPNLDKLHKLLNNLKETFKEGKTINLQIQENAIVLQEEYEFSHWGGDCERKGEDTDQAASKCELDPGRDVVRVAEVTAYYKEK